jgi:hypothetical protein
MNTGQFDPPVFMIIRCKEIFMRPFSKGPAFSGLGLSLILPLLLVFLFGCGGGRGNNTAGAASRGRAVFNIKWPDRSRLIPAASNSILVGISMPPYGFHKEKIVPRPSTGNTSTVTFDEVPVGTGTMVAYAFPNADATGHPQATGSVPFTISDNQTTTVILTMDSTIYALFPTPVNSYLAVGGSVQLNVGARDDIGALILTSPSKITYTPSSGAVTVDANGVMHAVSPGPATITITETESGKQGTVNVSVSPAVQPKAFYVLDQSNRIIRFTDMQGSGWTTFGTTGSGVGQFNVPTGVALDSQGRIYISDRLNNRIVRINDMSGAGWTTLGTQGSGQGQFSDPLGIAIDSADHIYVSDYSNHRIVKMNDISGSGWTTLGSPQIALNGPDGLTTDSSNRLYIVDTRAAGIIRVDDITGANYVSLGTPGTGVGQFSLPTDIKVDSAGKIYVADPGVGQSRGVVRMDDMTGANWVVRKTSSGLAPDSVAVDDAFHIYNATRNGGPAFERWDSFIGGQASQLYSTTAGAVGNFNSPYFVIFK